MPLFNPLITHVVNATPADESRIPRSLWWAVALGFMLGVALGHFSLSIP